MRLERLNRELEDMIGDSGVKVPGLGVIVYEDGAEVYSKFLGRRNVDSGKPVTRDTRFRAASVSKMFTVFSVLQLVERGKLRLDSDVSDYLGFELRNPNFPSKPITIEMLASHTSTLRDGKIYSSPPEVSVEEFFTPTGRFWEDGAHFATVADYFTYCNLNYGLLGTIIERVTGERFDLFQKENILKHLDTRADYVPSNLTGAAFDMLGTIYRKENPAGVWNEFGDWFGTIDDFKGVQPPSDTLALQNPYAPAFSRNYSLKTYRPGTNATIFSPQGGLRISFEELAHALECLINGGTFRGKEVLSRQAVETMFKPRWRHDGGNGDTLGGAIPNYGLGVYHIVGDGTNRVSRERVVNLVGHTGAAFGLLSGLFVIPGTRSGFVYMMNGTAFDEDSDPRSRGKFSGNYIWEERIMNALCNVFRA